MTKAVRLFLALCALALTAAIVAGCGGVPGNAVAEVDGNAIEKTAYDHWLQVAAKSSGQGQAVAVPQPPDYTACIAAKRKTTPKPAKGQPAVTDAQLKTQCKTEYEQLRNQVLQLLISFQWLQKEAAAQGITVTDADVKKSFDQQRKQSFPKDADYQKFLKTSGQTEADILLQVKADLLATKIRDKVVKGKDQVSDAQIADFYNKNKARFAQPQKRDLRVVLT
jgi:foldase protein PrsA